jgi:hypothetical protein
MRVSGVWPHTGSLPATDSQLQSHAAELRSRIELLDYYQPWPSYVWLHTSLHPQNMSMHYSMFPSALAMNRSALGIIWHPECTATHA